VAGSQGIIRTSTQLKLLHVDHSTAPAVKTSRLQSTVSDRQDTVQQTAVDLQAGQYSKQQWNYRQETVQKTTVDLQAGHSTVNSSGLTGWTQYSKQQWTYRQDTVQ